MREPNPSSMPRPAIDGKGLLGRREAIGMGTLGLLASATSSSRAVDASRPLGGGDRFRAETTLKHAHNLHCAAFSPDGSLLATAGYDTGMGGPDRITLWETATWKHRASFDGETTRVRKIGFLPDGKTLLMAGLDRSHLSFLDIHSGRRTTIFEKAGTAGIHSDFALTPDGTQLAFSCYEGAMIWKTGTWKLAQEVLGFRDQPLLLATSPAKDWKVFGLWLRAVSNFGIAFNIKAAPGLPPGVVVAPGTCRVGLPPWMLSRAPGVSRPFSSIRLACSRDGRSAAILNKDESGVVRVDLYDLRDPSSWLKTMSIGLSEASSDIVNCLDFTPDGQALAAGCGDGLIRFWDAKTGRTLAPIQKHDSDITGLAWSVDGTRLASTGNGDMTAKVWSVRDLSR